MVSSNEPRPSIEKESSIGPHSELKSGLELSIADPQSLDSASHLENEGSLSVDDSITSDSDIDGDSGVSGFSGTSSTASLRSSIYQHVKEYGRTYHGYKEGKYLLPNDEQEQDRLEIQHALFGVTLHDKLYLAPLTESPQQVLDIGTGTGVWAIEFAQSSDPAPSVKCPWNRSQCYSTAIVLVPHSPVLESRHAELKSVPPNCRFEVDDAEDEWLFSTKFDFIHGRALLSCFHNPAAVIRQAFEALAPGGYLEMQDGIFPMKYIGQPPVDSDLYKWNELVVEGARRSGRPWNNAEHYARWMREIGFEDVVEQNFYWPTSQWAKGDYFKKVALYFQEDMLNGLEGISMKVLTRFMGWTAEEVKALLIGVKRDFKDRSIHAYLSIKIVYGRKPVAVS